MGFETIFIVATQNANPHYQVGILIVWWKQLGFFYFVEKNVDTQIILESNFYKVRTYIDN